MFRYVFMGKTYGGKACESCRQSLYLEMGGVEGICAVKRRQGFQELVRGK